MLHNMLLAPIVVNVSTPSSREHIAGFARNPRPGLPAARPQKGVCHPLLQERGYRDILMHAKNPTTIG